MTHYHNQRKWITLKMLKSNMSPIRKIKVDDANQKKILPVGVKLFSDTLKQHQKFLKLFSSLSKTLNYRQ